LADIGTESPLTETANGGEGAKRISSHLEKVLSGSEGKNGKSTQDERGVIPGEVTEFVATNETTLTPPAGVAVNDPTIVRGDVLEVVTESVMELAISVALD
jgi:hypothetical protein